MLIIFLYGPLLLLETAYRKGFFCSVCFFCLHICGEQMLVEETQTVHDFTFCMCIGLICPYRFISLSKGPDVLCNLDELWPLTLRWWQTYESHEVCSPWKTQLCLCSPYSVCVWRWNVKILITEFLYPRSSAVSRSWAAAGIRGPGLFLHVSGEFSGNWIFKRKDL